MQIEQRQLVTDTINMTPKTVEENKKRIDSVIRWLNNHRPKNDASGDDKVTKLIDILLDMRIDIAKEEKL